LGSDLFSQIVRDDLLESGIGISGIETAEGSSPVVVALIGPEGQRTFVSARGPASGRVHSTAYSGLLKEAAMVHISGYSFQDSGSRATALGLMSQAHHRGIAVSLDPSPLFAENHDPDGGWLDGIGFFFPNLQEATSLTGVPDPEDAIGALRDLGVETVAVTMGADGCLVNDGQRVLYIPAFGEFAVTDTTGAGDAFAGGFLAVTMAGGTTRQACLVGNFAAARVISQPGGHAATPSVRELQRFAERISDPQMQEAARLLEVAGASHPSSRGGK
jgi:sugar/nucleoside kinase (ribokinase family)